MRVLIVGGGIAGLSLAAFLKEKNIDCEIAEKAANYDNLGYAINIWNNGRAMLEKLGLEHKFDHAGIAEPDYFLATGKGKIMKLFHMHDFHKKYWPAFTSIHRSDLHYMLMDKIKDVPFRMSHSVNNVIDLEDSVEVEFNNGDKVEYDLVVGADGNKSQVREVVFGKGYLHFVNWRAYFAWIDNKFPIPKGVFEMSETGQLCIFFNQREGKNLAVLATPADHKVWDEAGDRMERLKKHFKGCKFLLPEILESVQASDLMPTDIGFVKMDKWVKGRVVLIGDAAHAMEPFAGQGGSMAMEDAYVLAEEIAKEGVSIEQALLNYQKRRQPRIKEAREHSRPTWHRSKIVSSVYYFLRNNFAPLVPVHHFTEGYEKILKEKI